jgi:hypothetical protein
VDPIKDLIVPAVQSDLGQKAIEQTTEFLGNVLKEPGQAIGGLLGLGLNRRLFRNIVEAVVEARQLLKDAGVTERDVPLSILHPSLEGASHEEDPDMRTIWARMLANEADPSQDKPVLPSFPAILKDLTHRDVRFLDGLFQSAKQQCNGKTGWKSVSDVPFSMNTLLDAYFEAGLCKKRLAFVTVAEAPTIQDDFQAFGVTLGSVERHNIVRRIVGMSGNDQSRFSSSPRGLRLSR